MPYISLKGRSSLRNRHNPQTPGELAFVLSDVVNGYIERLRQRPEAGGVRYSDLAGTLGALESTKREFERRVVDPYEDEKRAENGDVFEVARAILSPPKPLEINHVPGPPENTTVRYEPGAEASGGPPRCKVHVAETRQSRFCQVCGSNLGTAAVRGEDVVLANDPSVR